MEGKNEQKIGWDIRKKYISMGDCFVYVLTGAKRSLATTVSQTVANDFAKCFFFKVTKAIKIRAP